MRLVYAEITRLMGAIRPDAIALCDSFGFTDHHLKSTIGRYDGNVYEAIYDEAKKSPLNVQHMVGWVSVLCILLPYCTHALCTLLSYYTHALCITTLLTVYRTHAL
jgi:hypothetical protein